LARCRDGLRCIAREGSMSDREAHESIPDEGLIPPQPKTVDPLRTDPYAPPTIQEGLSGGIAHEMLTGRRLFEHPDWGELLRMHREQEPLSPRRFVPDLPEGICRVLLRALQKDPNRRFITCEDFAQALGCSLLRARPPLPEVRAIATVVELSGHFEAYAAPFTKILESAWWWGGLGALAIAFRWMSSEWVNNRSKMLAALTADALWLWSRSEVLRLPLAALVSVLGGKDDKQLRLEFLTADGPVEQNLTFPHTGPRTEFARLLQDAALGKAARPVLCFDAPRVDPVVLLSRQPSTRYQTLGAVEFQHPVPSHAEAGLRLRAATMGADAVVDVREESLPGFKTTVRRVSGTAIKAVDAAGQMELRSFRYSGQVASLCGGMIAVTLLPLLCLAVLFQTRAKPSDLWFVPLGLAACWPLVVTMLLRACLWPQLVRPAAVATVTAGLGFALLSLPIGIDVMTGSPVAGAWEIAPRRARLVGKVVLPLMVVAAGGLIGHVVFLGNRAWRAHREYRLATGAAARRPPWLRRVVEALAMAASLATVAVVAVALAAATVDAHQRASRNRGQHSPPAAKKPRASAAQPAEAVRVGVASETNAPAGGRGSGHRPQQQPHLVALVLPAGQVAQPDLRLGSTRRKMLPCNVPRKSDGVGKQGPTCRGHPRLDSCLSSAHAPGR
jgi:hypothetical protein